MSYRLVKLWDKKPKAAAIECSIYVALFAIGIAAAISDGFNSFPPIWQIILLVLGTGGWIWMNFWYAKVLKDKDNSINK